MSHWTILILYIRPSFPVQASILFFIKANTVWASNFLFILYFFWYSGQFPQDRELWDGGYKYFQMLLFKNINMPYETPLAIIIFQNLFLYFKFVSFNIQNLSSPLEYKYSLSLPNIKIIKSLYQPHIYNFSMTLSNIHQFTFIFLDQKCGVVLSHLFWICDYSTMQSESTFLLRVTF